MSRDKQIEEMAKTVCHLDRTCDQCMTSFECKAMTYAKRFYDKGYRKASEVAREIFEEIEENLNNLIRYYKEKRKYVTEIEYSELEQRYCDIKIKTFEERLLKIANLRKKYTEGGKETND
jgi:hypothetical protein